MPAGALSPPRVSSTWTMLVIRWRRLVSVPRSLLERLASSLPHIHAQSSQKACVQVVVGVPVFAERNRWQKWRRANVVPAIKKAAGGFTQDVTIKGVPVVATMQTA